LRSLLAGDVGGDGVGAPDPGGVDHVAEHGGAGGEAVGYEVARLWGSSGSEAAHLFQLIELFDSGGGVAEIGHVGLKEVAVNGLGGSDFGLDVEGGKIGGDEGAFELRVNLVAGGVAVGVGAGPPVVLDGGVEGLRTIADIVAEPTGVEDDGGFVRFWCPDARRSRRGTRAWRL